MASLEPGTIVFQRGQTQDSEGELWDDTALIKAYDNAVNMMKSKMGVKDVEDNKSQDSQKRKRRSKRKKNKRKSKKWKPGDMCRAVYTEDNILYDAEIISVDTENETCVVCYVGYGNEEEKKLSELKVMSRKSQQQQQNMTSDLDTDSCMEWNGQTTFSPQNSRKQKPKSSTFQTHPDKFDWPEFSRVPPYQGMPHGIPFVPPPPPPMTEDLAETDNDALSSMLMSWYMSGYHTGYYQFVISEDLDTVYHSLMI
ncbi:hypothetical protein KUTeg_017836 [Tegillarca granosa]|uniref:Tudor domain-containing protein n=1 Tax=Tegillarca granosa TaxID=220873 RepID=A0ABQ9EG38_TEGGR|nr:hypothetical protein KUTeg_017836 [Tegillarca granosa]